MKKFIITTVLAFALATTASAAPLKPTTLRVGSTGQTVMTVQQKLLDLGLSDSAVDGKYGRKTAVAVAKFQLSKNLKSDGLVGEKTLALILASKTSSTIQSSIDSSSMKTETVSTSVTTNNTAPVVPVKTTTIDATASRTTKPIIDVPVVIPDVPLSDELAWRILCRDGKPHIQVLSPNGGEVYQAGQQVEVKWRSCNFGTSNVYVQIIGWNPDWFSAEGYPNRVNTGSTVITIPNSVVVNGQSQIPLGGYNVPEGKKFSVEVGKQYTVSGPSIMDRSDNLFTINASTIDMCPNISGIQTTIPAGMIKDVSGNCVVVSSVSSPTSMWENLCTDGQPRAQIISPNGNEWYRAGQQMEVKWKTCNHPAGATIQVGYMWSDSANGPGGYQNDTAVNDGIETYDLGVNAYNGEWRFSGKYYKAFVGFSSTNRDYSDDFFTIWDGNIIKPSPRANSVN